jgi:DNA-directed RNA polymerase specialized sigma24 family protein
MQMLATQTAPQGSVFEALKTHEALAAGGCLESWRAVVDRPDYQAALDRCARRVLRRTSTPLAWLQDVKHDAMLLLLRQLRHLWHHDAKRLRVDASFPLWLAGMTRRHCQEAVRKVRAGQRRTRQFEEREDFAGREIDHDALLDLRISIGSLALPMRTVLTQQAAGKSLHEIAAELDLTYTKVWRLSRRGIEQLRAVFLGQDWSLNDHSAGQEAQQEIRKKISECAQNQRF